MKNALKMAALMLCAATMMTACNCNTSCNSGENKMAQVEKAASEFKATLKPGNVIIGEKMDSAVQKVFYLDPSDEAYGVNPINNIMMHDYATNETKALLPEEDRINDYLVWGELIDPELAENEEYKSFNHCFNLDYRSSELIGDRLFMMIHTEMSYDMETSLLFYVNVLDNSLHYVCTCDDVRYDKANGVIDVHDELMKPAGADLEYNYTISASLSDKEYAALRNEIEEIEIQMSDKWREENAD